MDEDEIPIVAKLIHESYMMAMNDGVSREEDKYETFPPEASKFKRAYEFAAEAVILYFKDNPVDIGIVGLMRRILEESKIIASIKAELELMYGLKLNISDYGHVSIGILKGPTVKYGESPILSVINSMKEAGKDVPR